MIWIVTVQPWEEQAGVNATKYNMVFIEGEEEEEEDEDASLL